jgi:hypothetical protein
MPCESGSPAVGRGLFARRNSQAENARDGLGARSVQRSPRLRITPGRQLHRTYGHLAQDAEDQDRDLLDAYDASTRNDSGHAVGSKNGDEATA